ncbi:MAG: winged helix-turn-helix transcriptional regulator [Desulfomonile tiedjei]|nr:winged helix-turn-helix transcriptional regulator [Desulfomonile tiedjei]
MKKEARTQAQRMFLKAGGKITNREIAKEVNVNPLTVGRWKRDDGWDSQLKGTQQPEGKAAGGAVRKKAARDKALKIYLDAEGNLTNKDLARRVGVSPATISKWKDQDRWMDQLKPAKLEAPEGAAEELELDMGELASPEQIIQINRRIDGLLQRDFLTSGELADLAQAKNDLLAAVETYLAIVREVGEIKGAD